MDKELFNALKVRFIRLRFTLAFLDDSILPKNKVSAIRGGMGEMLLRMNCVRDRQCETCDFTTECIVQRIMYPTLIKKPEFMTSDGSIGYILECEDHRNTFKAGEKLDFYLILFGKTIAHFNQFYQAFTVLGEQDGLGKHHAKFQITMVRNTEGMPIVIGNSINMDRYVIHSLYDHIIFRKMHLDTTCKKYMILFDSPLTLKYKNTFLHEFHIEAILAAIRRRIYILNCFEETGCDILKEGPAPQPEILVQKHYPVSVKRYSMRKNEKMILKGLKGYLMISGITEDTMTLLLVGELIHIGKNTSFGFGHFHIKCINEE